MYLNVHLNVNSFLSMSCIDGEGIRSVLFLQGCPLKCIYCHNPETQSFSNKNIMHIDNIIKKLSKYKNYYGENGGLTVSGGEPLYQADAVIELFKKCKSELKISTCIETSGNYPDKFYLILEELIDLSDIIFCDYKFLTQDEYSLYTNGNISKTEKFLSMCPPEKTIVRSVIIPGINNTEQYVLNLYNRIRNIGNFKVELLPFKTYCKTKYHELNKPFLFENAREATWEEMSYLQNVVERLSGMHSN